VIDLKEKAVLFGLCPSHLFKFP